MIFIGCVKTLEMDYRLNNLLEGVLVTMIALCNALLFIFTLELSLVGAAAVNCSFQSKTSDSGAIHAHAIF